MTKWHQLEPYSRDLVGRVTGFLNETRGHREQRARSAAVIAWAYERDRHLLRARASHSDELVPEAIAGACRWLRRDRVPSVNIVKSATDTAMSYLFTDPDPLVVGSDGAGFEQMREVEARTMALNATMNRPEAHDELWRVQRDFFVKGHFAAVPYFDGGRIAYRRLREEQLAWDPYESQDGEAFTRATIEVKDRSAFLAWYRALSDVPDQDKRVEKIRTINSRPSRNGGFTPFDFELQAAGPASDTDLILVVNIYRRASFDNAGDGRHTMLVYGCSGDPFSLQSKGAVVALDKEWPRSTFPVVTGSPWPADQGPGGTGMGHLMLPWQEYVDGLLYKIITTNEKYGYVKLLAQDTGDERLTPALEALATDGIHVVRIPPGVSNPPSYLDPQVIRKEDLDQLAFALQNSMSWYGINQVITQGVSQLGAGASGAALIEESYRPIDRMSDVVERWNRSRVQLGRETLHVIDDVLKINPKFRASFEDRNGRRLSVPWADLNRQTTEYTIDVERTGALGHTRAGRKQNIIEGAKMGIIPPSAAAEALLVSPDFRRAARLSMAARMRIETQLDAISSGGAVTAKHYPDEDNDLALAVEIATQYINLAHARDAKDTTIQRLREYKRQATALRDAQSQNQGATTGPAQDPAAELAALAAAQGAPSV